MNKAKITYRFENGRNPVQESGPRHKPEERAELEAPEWNGSIVAAGREESKKPSDKQYSPGAQPSFYDTAPNAQPPLCDTAPKAQPSLFDTGSLNHYTSDFGAWNSPIEAETKRVEELIRSSSAKPSMSNGETGHFDNEDTGFQEHRGAIVPWHEPSSAEVRYAKSARAPWLRVAASVTAAIATGVGCGYLVLTMFTGTPDLFGLKSSGKTETTAVTAPKAETKAAQDATADAKLPGVKSAAEAKAQEPAANKSAPAAANVTGQTAAVNLPARSYSLLQAGVFNTQSSAEAEQANLKKKGLPTALESADKFVLFAGMSSKKEDAVQVSQLLKEKKVEVYVKPLELPAVSRMKWNGKQTDAMQSYFTQGAKLVQMIDGLTVMHLRESKPTPLDTALLQAVKSAHQSWSSLQGTVNDGAGEEMKAVLPKLQQSMNGAVSALDEYKKNPSTAGMWQAQASLTQYVLAEKELLKTAAQ